MSVSARPIGAQPIHSSQPTEPEDDDYVFDDEDDQHESLVDAIHTSQHGVRLFRLGDAMADVESMRQELDDMRDVLMGRRTPPRQVGVATLLEVANAYYARALEMESRLLHREAEGQILKGSRAYKFRTGELRRFLELSKAACELGSRRITAAQQEIMLRGSV